MRRLLVLPAMIVSTAGCGDDTSLPGQLRPDDWEVVLRAPGEAVSDMASSPDGTLFVAMLRGPIRRLVGARWETIAPGQLDARGDPVQLYAPHRDTLFIASGPFVYRWDARGGMRREATPIDTVGVGCYDVGDREELKAIWGRGSGDVYAVGRHGLIVHGDGRAWWIEPNPLRARVPDLCQDGFQTELDAVAGDRDEVYAAGLSILRRSRTGRWEVMPRTAGVDTGGVMFAAAGGPDGVWIGGEASHDTWRGKRVRSWAAGYLLHRDGGRWRAHPLAERGMAEINGGAGRPGGPGVFWGIDRQVIVVRGDRRIDLYTVNGLHPVMNVRGAVAAGRDVYLGLEQRDDGTAVIARLRR